MTFLSSFATWLGGTSLTAFIAGHLWMVPALQTIHILAVAAVLISIVLINLFTLRSSQRDETLLLLQERLLPIVLIAVSVLAVTGVLLIVSEPTRAIFRTLFWVKMALILAALALTWTARRQPHAAGDAGASVAIPVARKGAAVLALLLWLAVIVAGRWIAYVEAWPGAPQ